MNPRDAWIQALETPGADFFSVFVARAREPEGARDAVREAVSHLTARVDWERYLPHVPHGLLGLRAVFRLRKILEEPSFLRILAAQLHAFAHEGRCSSSWGLGAIPRGTGDRTRWLEALATGDAPTAWGESLAFDVVESGDFLAVLKTCANDMANVGHKAVVAHHLRDLFSDLGESKKQGQLLLGLAAWLAASEPADHHWNNLAKRRAAGLSLSEQDGLEAPDLEDLTRKICDLGLIGALDAMCGAIREGAGRSRLLVALVHASAERILDARRDMEGKTSWLLVYLATVDSLPGELRGPEAWLQAAALANLFPGGDSEERIQPTTLKKLPDNPGQALLDAILDGEPARAMAITTSWLEQEGSDNVLSVLAEAASSNDPTFNHGSQIMALAAVADLLPSVPQRAGDALLVAMAKSLANGQGASDLCKMAERALAG